MIIGENNNEKQLKVVFYFCSEIFWILSEEGKSLILYDVVSHKLQTRLLNLESLFTWGIPDEN